MELAENGNFRMFAAKENGNSKRPFVCCKRKWETEVLPFLVGKQNTVIDICCVSKRAHLCLYVEAI
jgi:hypothetical protein